MEYVGWEDVSAAIRCAQTRRSVMACANAVATKADITYAYGGGRKRSTPGWSMVTKHYLKEIFAVSRKR